MSYEDPFMLRPKITDCEPEEVDQDAPRPWVLDDGTDECYDIVARPSYIRQALYAATHNNDVRLSTIGFMKD